MVQTKKVRQANGKRKWKEQQEPGKGNDGSRRKKMKDRGGWTRRNGNSESQLTSKSPAEGKQTETPQKTNHHLTEEQYAEVKRRKKEFDKMRMAWPYVFLNEIGEFSNLNLSADKCSPLFMSDIQSLLMFSLFHNKSPRLPRWAKVVRTRKFSHVVTVVVEGVSLSDLTTNKGDSSEVQGSVAPVKHTSENGTDNESQVRMEQVSDNGDCQSRWLTGSLPRTSNLMKFKLELLAPSKYNTEPTEELLNIPLSWNQKEKILKDFKSLKDAQENGKIFRSCPSMFPVAVREIDFQNKLKAEKVRLFNEDGKHMKSTPSPFIDKFDRRSLLLSPEDLWEYQYPLPVPGSPGYDDPEFHFTHDKFDEVTATSPMFGVDCEMCMTCIRQLELTSISIVNEQMELVYHKLVKPRNKIINYLTQYSGITKAMLANVTTTLQHVQKDLRKLFPHDAILVGHSLNSDLKAMKIRHPYVIDSSLVYNLTHIRKKRSSLKLLAKMFLEEVIQDSSSGHDPTEDAGASLRLIQLKLGRDVKFGDVLQGWKIPNGQNVSGVKEETTQDYKEETEILVNAPQRYATSLFQHAETLTIAMLTTPTCFKKYEALLPLISKKVCNVEILSGNKELSMRTAEVSMNMDFTYVHMKMDTKLSQCHVPESRQHQFKKLDKRLQRIHESAAAKTLLLYIFTGSSCDVPPNQRSNGFVMFDIKGQPTKSSLKAQLSRDQ